MTTGERGYGGGLQAPGVLEGPTGARYGLRVGQVGAHGVNPVLVPGGAIAGSGVRSGASVGKSGHSQSGYCAKWPTEARRGSGPLGRSKSLCPVSRRLIGCQCVRGVLWRCVIAFLRPWRGKSGVYSLIL